MNNLEVNHLMTQPRWLKAELHTHCNLDPYDYRIVPHSAEELIEEAARLHYQVLAITCHDLDVWTEDLSDYAASYGITLIPGMEVNVDGRWHTLVYNFGAGADSLGTFQQIRTLARPDTLVVAPHPYFPSTKCLRGLVEANVDVFDAIEISGFRVSGIDFNRRARKVAAVYRKTLVGNGDVHRLWQLGKTYTWIYSAPDVASILCAVKEGRVLGRVCSPLLCRRCLVVGRKLRSPADLAVSPACGRQHKIYPRIDQTARHRTCGLTGSGQAPVPPHVWVPGVPNRLNPYLSSIHLFARPVYNQAEQ